MRDTSEPGGKGAESLQPLEQGVTGCDRRLARSAGPPRFDPLPLVAVLWRRHIRYAEARRREALASVAVNDNRVAIGRLAGRTRPTRQEAQPVSALSARSLLTITPPSNGDEDGPE